MSALFEVLPQLSPANLLVAGVLALSARLLQMRGQFSWFAHLLWIFVLLKLLTPPLVDVPLLPLAETVPALPSSLETPLPSVPIYETEDSVGPLLEAPAVSPSTADLAGSEDGNEVGFTAIILALWLFGSSVVLFFSLRDALGFDRRMRALEESAPADLSALADRLAGRFGLRQTPPLVVVKARIAPLVWSLRGRPRVVIPSLLQETLGDDELELVLGHEMAHIARRDHLVRWLEWLVTVVFWWNPLIWWARRNLRQTEERCCDALVLERLHAAPRAYGHTLVTTIEHLSRGELHPPALAARLDSGGSLEGRLKMILDPRRANRPAHTLRLAALLMGLVFLPLGLANAQGNRDSKHDTYRAAESRILKAVAGGHITADDGRRSLVGLRQELWGEPKQAPRSKRGSQPTPLVSTHAIDPQSVQRYQRIKDAVRRGELSEADAAKKMRALKSASTRAHTHLATGESEKRSAKSKLIEVHSSKYKAKKTPTPDSHAALVSRYEEYSRALEAAVKQKIISRKGADKKLKEVRAKMFADAKKKEVAKLKSKAKSKDDPKSAYRAAELKTKNAISSGTISEAEGLRRLAEYRQKLWPEDSKKESRR